MSTDQWKTGTPDVAEGRRETFWCAIKGRNGKLFHRHLDYLNGHIMPLSDTCHDIAPEHAVPVGDDGDYKWTGWHEVSCDQCETQWGFRQEVIAWMRLPRYSAQPVADGPAGFSDAERVDFIIEKFMAIDDASGMLFFEGRLTFHKPNGDRARNGANSGGPSVLIAYGPEAQSRLTKLTDLGVFVSLNAEKGPQ